MSRITFNLAAKCDKAGRSQNQDNYWVCPDLTRWNAPVDGIVGTDEDVELSKKGALLVVADGMGGMKAGEVASELVIEGIKKRFSQIPDSILGNEADILKFIRDAIVESDESIKQYAQKHREAEGLGSTIVLLWLLGDKAYCGWCGDSRIYRFNPNNELVRLSHDHSYVQSLVDEGKIPEDEAFDHPDGNVITKALGDNGNKADPELKAYDVYQRDVFVLCSDGLCGLLQDAEINRIIADNCTSSKDTLTALWEAGEKANWTDNATIDILNVMEGGKLAKGRPDGYPAVTKKPTVKKDNGKPQVVSGGEIIFAKIVKPPYSYIIVIVSLCLLGMTLFHVFGGKKKLESTNHEFNIEVFQQVVGDGDGSGNSDGSQQTTPNQNGNGGTNGNNGNTNGGSPGRNNSANGTGNNHNSGGNAQNQQEQNGSSSGSQGSPSIENSGGINQGVINQLNQGNNGGSNHSNNQPTAPSDDFISIYNLLKEKFGDVNTTVKRINTTHNLFLTEKEVRSLDEYATLYRNNSRLLNGSDYYLATDAMKHDVDNFARLYNDVAKYLADWEYFQRNDPYYSNGRGNNRTQGSPI